MRRGELYWADLSAAVVPGREQIGHRPALVVQADQPQTGLPTVLIVPLTSKLKAASFFGTLLIDPSRQNGLTVPSVLLLFQLRAIDLSRLRGRIGELETAYIQQAHQTLRTLLALP